MIYGFRFDIGDMRTCPATFHRTKLRALAANWQLNGNSGVRPNGHHPLPAQLISPLVRLDLDPNLEF